MAIVISPTRFRRILRLCLILTFVSTFVVLVIGIALCNLNRDIKELNLFLAEGVEIQPNYEQSLSLYTEKIEDVSGYLLTLRPENEEGYVKFISAVEGIGQDLELDVDVKASVENPDEKRSAVRQSIDYDVSFYGNERNLVSFLTVLESMDYLIGIVGSEFRDAKYMSIDEKKKRNVKLKLRLYIK